MSFHPKTSTAVIDGINYNLVAFYYPGINTDWDDFYQAPFLGNFWEEKVQVTIEGITGIFHTSEAAFQATKWWQDEAARKRFENALTGADALHVKKSLPRSHNNWAGLGREGAMKHILMAKFKHPALQAGLIATGDAYLLEHNQKAGRDSYWSDDHTGNGLNMLGKCLMEIRKSYRGEGSPYSGEVVNMTQQVKQLSKA